MSETPDPAAELNAALRHCALADRSDLARLRGAGADTLDLLHRLSTQDLKALPVGEGRLTILTTAKGRIVDGLFVHRPGERDVLLIGGPGRTEALAAHLRRYTFGEDIALSDLGPRTRHIAIVGPRAAEAVSAAGFRVPAPLGAVDTADHGIEGALLGEDGSTSSGFSLIAAERDAGAAWSRLEEAVRSVGGRAAGSEAIEAWRILRGVPVSGAEMCDDNNPLEVGLREAVSFTKGCYVGQEVVARLNTYDKVSRILAGFVLESGAPAPPVGAAIVHAGRTVGRITSAVRPPGRTAPLVLAVVKSRDLPEDAEVVIGEDPGASRARRSPLPFGETP